MYRQEPDMLPESAMPPRTMLDQRSRAGWSEWAMNNVHSGQLQVRNKSTLLLFSRHNPAQGLTADRGTDWRGRQASGLLSNLFQGHKLS
jgi:hypothetical protein